MVDSVAVLPPGWRAFDNNGNLITDGVLSFFDAGTSDALTVYADADLDVSLGTTVNCNSAGFPVTSGNAKTLIYTGTDPYKIRLSSTLIGGTVFEFDNVRGALDTSNFLTTAAVADRTIVNVATDRNVTISDKGSLLNVNCSGGTITLTFDDASDMSGFWGGVRHDGTANQVKVTGDGTDLFGLGSASTTAFALTGRGHTVWISCDGSSFKVESECPPLINGTVGVIVVADRLSSPPASPNPGDRYILTTGPSGDWSSFAEHDIAEADGAGSWFKYTPAGDCGWIAYVQDEDRNYQYRSSAWISYASSDTVAGFIEIATQAEMETGTSTTLAVTPGRQHHHPGHPKCWAYVTVSSGTPTLQTSYNITSITDSDEAELTITIATDFSSVNWVSLATTSQDGNDETFVNIISKAAGSIVMETITDQGSGSEGAGNDPDAWNFAGFGDQA